MVRRRARYFLRASTAQTERGDGAINSEQPCRYGSVLDAFRCKVTQPLDVKEDIGGGQMH